MEHEGTRSLEDFRRRLYLVALAFVVPLLAGIAYVRVETEPFTVPVYLALVVGLIGTFLGILTRRLSLEQAERLVIFGVATVVTARLIGVAYLEDVPASQLRQLVVESIGPTLVACVLLIFLASEPRQGRNRAVALCIAFAVVLLPRVLFNGTIEPELGVAVGRQTMMLALVTTLAYALASVKTQLAEERVRARALDELANTDPLTSISNRRGGQQALAHHLARVERYGGQLCVALIDLDNFKLRNDHYGHAAGDAALVEIASRLKGELRASDVFARWGGDELLIIAPGLDAEAALAAAERWRRAIAELEFSAGPVRLTASIGVAIHEPGDNLDTLLTRADRALYEVKERGGDAVSFSVHESLSLTREAPDAEAPGGRDEAERDEGLRREEAGRRDAGRRDAGRGDAGRGDAGRGNAELGADQDELRVLDRQRDRSSRR